MKAVLTSMGGLTGNIEQGNQMSKEARIQAATTSSAAGWELPYISVLDNHPVVELYSLQHYFGASGIMQ